MKEKLIQEYQDIIFGDLCLCGCGEPEATLQMILEYLNLEKIYRNDDMEYEVYKDLKEEFIENYKEYLFLYMLYVLNENEILDHGSSVYASWLTDKGKRLLELSEEVAIDEVFRN